MKRFPYFRVRAKGLPGPRLILTALAMLFLAPLPCQAQSDLLQKYCDKRFGSARLRHGAPIQCLAFAPEDKLLAAGGGNDSIRLWNTETGNEQRSFNEHWVTALAFAPDGTLASAGEFRKIRLWNTANGSERAVLDAHLAPVRSLAFSPDGVTLASGGRDGSVMLWLWKVNITRPIDTLLGHTDEVAALTFAHHGKRLASAGSDRTIRQWTLDGSDVKLPTIEAGCAVTGLVYSQDDKMLISAGDDGIIRLWDAASGKALGVLKGHQDTIVSLLLSADGDTLVSSARDGSIRQWNLPARKPGRVHRRDNCDGDALALSGDGKLLAFAGQRCTIHMVDADSGKERFPDLGLNAPVAGLGMSRDGKWLVSISDDRVINLWNRAEGKKVAGHTAGPLGDLTVPLALAGLLDGQKIRPGETVTSADPILAVAGTADGKAFAVGHRSGKVGLHRLEKDKIVLEPLKYPGLPYALAFSQDGKTLAVSGGSKVLIFDVAGARQIREFLTRSGPPPTQPRVACLAFSSSGRFLAVGCYDGIVRLFDPATGEQTAFFEGHLSAVLGLAFSPDGRTLATGSFDQTVRLWEVFNSPGIEPKVGSRRDVDPDTGLIVSFTGHIGPVQATCFAPGGRTLYTGSTDTTILEWDATRAGKDGVLPEIELSETDLDDAWTKLATLDSALGQEAAWKLSAGPKQSIPYLAGKLFYVDAKRLDKLFADLNDDSYSVRFKATEELASFCGKYGMWMRGRLEDAVRKPPSAEVRYRAEQLLDKLMDMPSTLSLQQERIRVHRAMQVLEQAGNNAALESLRNLARGAPERHLQLEAQFALDRLKQRGKTE